MPPGARHGTVVAVPEKILKGLLAVEPARRGGCEEERSAVTMKTRLLCCLDAARPDRRACGGRVLRRHAPGMFAQGPAPGAAPPVDALTMSSVAEHRPDGAGRPRAGVSRPAGRHEHDVCRRRGGRDLQDDEWRRHVEGHLRQPAGGVDWRHRHRPHRSQRDLRRHGRGQSAQRRVHRRRHLQVDRRRRALGERRPSGQREDSRASSSTRATPTSCTRARSAASGARTRNAGSSRRWTAGRAGRRCSTRTT